MGANADFFWGGAIGLLLVGLPLWFFAGPISSWNRRTGSKWGWNVPRDGSAGSLRWSEKYMRVVGIVATAAGFVMLIFAVVRSN